MKDLIIIGAGPAGLSAAIYGMRAGMDLTVLERLSPGGQVMNTFEVENYPGFPEPIAGWELMSRMEEQARRLGTVIEGGDVGSISRDDQKNTFTLSLADGSTREAKAVIAAAGASYRRLGIPGEEEFLGHGVSFCATCDGPFFKDRVCAVIGGGDTALEEALFLTRFASSVYLIHRRDQYRGAKILQERIASNQKIVPVLDSVVASIEGSTAVERITVTNVKDNTKRTLEVSGVFIFIGYQPNTGFLPREILNEGGEVIVDSRMRTPLPGLFAAGDLRAGSRRQIVMAASDGAMAALEAYDYLTFERSR